MVKQRPIKANKVELKKWTGNRKTNKVEKHSLNEKGLEIMAVSMAKLPVIEGEAADKLLEAFKKPTITKEFLEELKNRPNRITFKREK